MMATKINVIISENSVYATYLQTICFKAKFENEFEMYNQIKDARATAFAYSLGFSSVLVNEINNPEFKNDDDIFNYLSKNN